MQRLENENQKEKDVTTKKKGRVSERKRGTKIRNDKTGKTSSQPAGNPKLLPSLIANPKR